MWRKSFNRWLIQCGGNGTFATFTAGIVKRGLQSVGFEINKIKGFGQKKRDADRYFPHPPLLNFSLLCKTKVQPKHRTLQLQAWHCQHICRAFLPKKRCQYLCIVKMDNLQLMPQVIDKVLYPLLNGKSMNQNNFYNRVFYLLIATYDKP